jgi:[ribosomal protein S18]-alanine N-acetyltransferase
VGHSTGGWVLTVAELTRSALTDVDVVPMRGRHLRQVLAIERLVYPRPWSQAMFASELAQRETRRYVVALRPIGGEAVGSATGGKRGFLGWRRRSVLGYAGLMLTLDEAHITTVAVHPHHHRRKIASRLLHAVLCEARVLGASAATLEVRIDNQGAQRLYMQFGFAPVGTRPGYYAETGEDAMIMWAYDLQSAAFADRLAAQAARLDVPGGSSGVPDLYVPWVQGRIGLGGAAGPAGGRGYQTGEGGAAGPAGGRGYQTGEGGAPGPAGGRGYQRREG